MRHSFMRSAEPSEYGGARVAELERGAKAGDNYEFPMTLATEGEASDGDILSIAGAEIPERLPMLASHRNDPEGTLGSIVNAEKLLGARPPKLRATGIIELGGTGPRAEIRNDVAHMIEAKHLRAVSIKWQGLAVQPRRNLPTEHPHYVKEDAAYPMKYGMHFEKWRALEGSVVAVGADPKAMIGRAQDAKSAEARAFWQRLSGEAQPTEQVLRNRAAETMSLALDMAREAKVPASELMVALCDALELDEAAWKLIVVERLGSEGYLPYDDFVIPQAVADELATLRGRLQQLTKPRAPAPVDEDAATMVARVLAEHGDRLESKLGEMFTRATGRTLP